MSGSYQQSNTSIKCPCGYHVCTMPRGSLWTEPGQGLGAPSGHLGSPRQPQCEHSKESRQHSPSLPASTRFTNPLSPHQEAYRRTGGERNPQPRDCEPESKCPSPRGRRARPPCTLTRRATSGTTGEAQQAAQHRPPRGSPSLPFPGTPPKFLLQAVLGRRD